MKKMMTLLLICFTFSASATSIGCWYQESDIGAITLYGLESGQARSYIKDKNGDYPLGNNGELFIESASLTNNNVVTNIDTSSSANIYNVINQEIKNRLDKSYNAISFKFVLSTLNDKEEKVTIIYSGPTGAVDGGKTSFTGGKVVVSLENGETIAKLSNCWLETKTNGLE